MQLFLSHIRWSHIVLRRLSYSSLWLHCIIVNVRLILLSHEISAIRINIILNVLLLLLELISLILDLLWRMFNFAYLTYNFNIFGTIVSAYISRWLLLLLIPFSRRTSLYLTFFRLCCIIVLVIILIIFKILFKN